MTESLKLNYLRILLRVLAVGLLGTSVPWITMILLDAPVIAPGGTLAPMLRFQPYNSAYESMLGVILIAWAMMLWRASGDPAQHRLFIDFTIWANLGHGLVMVIATPIQKGMVMTFIEAVPLFVIAAALWALRPPQSLLSAESDSAHG